VRKTIGKRKKEKIREKEKGWPTTTSFLVMVALLKESQARGVYGHEI